MCASLQSCAKTVVLLRGFGQCVLHTFGNYFILCHMYAIETGNELNIFGPVSCVYHWLASP